MLSVHYCNAGVRYWNSTLPIVVVSNGIIVYMKDVGLESNCSVVRNVEYYCVMSWETHRYDLFARGVVDVGPWLLILPSEYVTSIENQCFREVIL